MRWMTLLLTAGALVLGSADTALAKSPLRWKLEIQPDKEGRNPASRVVIANRNGSKQVYWYFVYTIRNTHEEALPLHLNVRAVTDSSKKLHNEGYYPRALKLVRNRHGKDIKDSTQLEGHELAPGATVRAVAVFQFRKEGSKAFDERMDRITLRIDGYADPVKKNGLDFIRENLELWMSYEKIGDQYDPYRESVHYKGSEEKVIR